MTDADRLRALSLAYAAAVDALDGEAFAALFTGDGELWVPDPSRGPEPTVCRSGADRLRRIPSGLARYHVTHHRVGPAEYVVTGDSATGEVTGVAHHLTASVADPADPSHPADPAHPTGAPSASAAGPGVDTVWFLRYEDRYRRGDDGWRIARRSLHLRWIEERPVARVGPARAPGRERTLGA
jgi:ketosteroid isomerase-like protein